MAMIRFGSSLSLINNLIYRASHVLPDTLPIVCENFPVPLKAGAKIGNFQERLSGKIKNRGKALKKTVNPTQVHN